MQSMVTSDTVLSPKSDPPTNEPGPVTTHTSLSSAFRFLGWPECRNSFTLHLPGTCTYESLSLRGHGELVRILLVCDSHPPFPLPYRPGCRLQHVLPPSLPSHSRAA